MGAASDSRDAGFELPEPLYSPPPAGRSLARSCLLTSPLDFLRKQGLDYVASTRCCASDRPHWRGLFFVFRPAGELPRRLGLLAPWAWESRLSTERGGTATGATERGPRPGAAMQRSPSPEARRPPRAQSPDRTPQWTRDRVAPEETESGREPRAAESRR